MNSSSHKLEIKHIGYSYERDTVLLDVSFSVSEQECVAFLGPSGCGKSTLLSVISGLYTPSAGEIYVDGEPHGDISPIFAYMPQKDLLLPWMSVLENVCLYGTLHNLNLRKKAMERLEEFGLKGYEHAYPAELSGGMRQRAAFLRTAMCDADILLLDEPFASLDVITREEMQEWLGSLRKTWNKTMVLVTHDIDEAMLLADRILILDANSHTITGEFEVNEPYKTKEWLFQAYELKQEIYHRLKDSMKL